MPRPASHETCHSVRSIDFSWSLGPVSHNGYVEFLTDVYVTTMSCARIARKAHNSLNAAGG